MASEDDIKKAFQGGDDDADDGLSANEASTAIEKLTGKSIAASTIELACGSCGISLSGHEMDLDEFTSLVRHLEDSGEL